MKKLVVFYSFDGNTRLIAQKVAETAEADLLELKPKKEIKTHGFMKFLWGGRQVVLKKKPKLHPFDKNPEEYDLLFIGTPVWAWSYTPPLGTFFSTVDLSGKKIALFYCHGGQMGQTQEKMKEQLTGNEIIGAIDFLEPLKKKREESVKRAREWVEEILAKIEKSK